MNDLITVVDSKPNIHNTYDVDALNTTELVAQMNPFHLKLFQYLTNVIEHKFEAESDELRKHYVSVILFKAFKFFPTAPGIYITYAMAKIHDNDSMYINELQKHTIHDTSNARTKSTNIAMLACVIFIVIIIIIAVTSKNNETQHTDSSYKIIHNDIDKSIIK